MVRGGRTRPLVIVDIAMRRATLTRRSARSKASIFMISTTWKRGRPPNAGEREVAAAAAQNFTGRRRKASRRRLMAERVVPTLWHCASGWTKFAGKNWIPFDRERTFFQDQDEKC